MGLSAFSYLGKTLPAPNAHRGTGALFKATLGPICLSTPGSPSYTISLGFENVLRLAPYSWGTKATRELSTSSGLLLYSLVPNLEGTLPFQSHHAQVIGMNLTSGYTLLNSKPINLMSLISGSSETNLHSHLHFGNSTGQEALSECE